MPDAASNSAGTLLLDCLCAPEHMGSLTPGEWDLLIRVARLARLLPRLAWLANSRQLAECIPASAAEQLQGATVYCTRLHDCGRYELDRIAWALGELVSEVTLLKGIAYLAADLPLSRGRLFADVDLLVSEDRLASVEQTLLKRGWSTTKRSDYDQAYYRRWMHEIPALRHWERQLEVDIHHTIVPRTARLKPDPAKLLAVAEPLSGTPFRVLSPADTVLHAAVHLFHDDALFGALSQLYDLHELMVHHAKRPAFWSELVPRAVELGLTRPLFYALRYARHYFDTPVPGEVMAAANVGAPTLPVLRLMDQLVPSALLPKHPDSPRGAREVNRLLLYARSHWLRMPPLLLARHLGYKAFLRLSGRSVQTTEAFPDAR